MSLFHPVPWPSATADAEQAVSIVVLSDTHGKHGHFGGFEVPAEVFMRKGVPASAQDYFVERGSANAVAAELAEVISRSQEPFLEEPLPEPAAGEVHCAEETRTLPVLLLSGNKRQVVLQRWRDRPAAPTIPYADVLAPHPRLRL